MAGAMSEVQPLPSKSLEDPVQPLPSKFSWKTQAVRLECRDEPEVVNVVGGGMGSGLLPPGEA